MGAAPGIAGSQRPEIEGIYLARSLSEGLWFAAFGTHASIDVWSVDVRGLALLDGPDGFPYFPGSIGPERLQLVEASLDATAARQRQTENRGL
jgi:hypothetical protein